VSQSEELLSQLRALQPPDVSRMPAPGWWLVLLVFSVCLCIAWYLYRRYQRGGWHRQAMAELNRLRAQVPTESTPRVLATASRLVRRVALVARPRAEVASLQGKEWLDELDADVVERFIKSAARQPAAQVRR